MDTRKYFEYLIGFAKEEFFSSDPKEELMNVEAEKLKKELTPELQIPILQSTMLILKPLSARQRAAGYIALMSDLGWPRRFDPEKFPLHAEIWPITAQLIRPAHGEKSFSFFTEPFALYEKLLADLDTLSPTERKTIIEKIEKQLTEGLGYLREHHPDIYPDEGFG